MMGLVTGLLLRYGAGFLIPFIVPIGLGLLFGTGSGMAWLFDWTDYKSSILLAATGTALGYMLFLELTGSKSPLMRLAMAIILAGACYLKGGIDEGLKTQKKILAAVSQTHETYKKAYNAETERLKRIEVEMVQQAEVDKRLLGQEKYRLRAELIKIKEEAAASATSKERSILIESVDRLNRLRHDKAAQRNKAK